MNTNIETINECGADGVPQLCCPLTQVMGVLSSKWAFPILHQLLMAEGPLRFGVLKKGVGIVTQRELARTLRHFEAFGLVTRTVYAEVPPRVEYALTPLGQSLREPIMSLGNWAKEHAHEFNQMRAESSGKDALQSDF
jgi:DNA-binding HxlR family transcriptional regulator